MQKKWEKIKEYEKQEVIEYVKRYVASTLDKKFRKNPLMYLNGEYWLDEIQTRSIQRKNNRSANHFDSF